jgi:hypothetical protein
MSQKIVYTVNYQTEIIRNIKTMEVVSESDPTEKKIFIAYNACLDSMYFADETGTKSYSIMPETIVKDTAGIKTEFAVNTSEGFMQVIIMDKFQDWFNSSTIDHKRDNHWADILIIEIDKTGMPKMRPNGFIINQYYISDITIPHYN